MKPKKNLTKGRHREIAFNKCAAKHNCNIVAISNDKIGFEYKKCEICWIITEWKKIEKSDSESTKEKEK